MSVIFIDYSEAFYSAGANSAKPEKRKGKFVQIRKGDAEYLVFSPTELTPYHANIVERFCFENGIGGSYGEEGRRYDIHDPQWVVVGGGKFEVDGNKRSIRLYDDSLAYGKFDSRGLKKKIHQVDALSDYEIRIE